MWRNQIETKCQQQQKKHFNKTQCHVPSMENHSVNVTTCSVLSIAQRLKKIHKHRNNQYNNHNKSAIILSGRGMISRRVQLKGDTKNIRPTLEKDEDEILSCWYDCCCLLLLLLLSVLYFSHIFTSISPIIFLRMSRSQENLWLLGSLFCGYHTYTHTIFAMMVNKFDAFCMIAFILLCDFLIISY